MVIQYKYYDYVGHRSKKEVAKVPDNFDIYTAARAHSAFYHENAPISRAKLQQGQHLEQAIRPPGLTYQGKPRRFNGNPRAVYRAEWLVLLTDAGPVAAYNTLSHEFYRSTYEHSPPMMRIVSEFLKLCKGHSVSKPLNTARQWLAVPYRNVRGC